VRHRRLWTPLLFTVLAVVGACAGPGEELAFLTPSEAGDHVLAIAEDMSSIADGAMASGLAEALWFPGDPGVFPAPTPGFIMLMRDDPDGPPRLATGTFTWNEVAVDWDYDPSPATGLVLRWTPSEPGPPPMPSNAGLPYELAFAWSGAVPVTLPTGEVVSGPTGSVIQLTAHDLVVVDLTLDQAWRQTDCGLLAEARSMRLDGSLMGVDAGPVATIRDLGVTSPFDGRWLVTGGVTAYAGALTMSLDVDLAFDVTFERSPTCWPLLETVSAIDASVEADLASPGRNVELAFGATAEPNPQGYGIDLVVRAGRFVVGSKRVTFEGAIPADAEPTLLLTFAGGEKLTLEEFISEYVLDTVP